MSEYLTSNPGEFLFALFSFRRESHQQLTCSFCSFVEGLKPISPFLQSFSMMVFSGDSLAKDLTWEACGCHGRLHKKSSIGSR